MQQRQRDRGVLARHWRLGATASVVAWGLAACGGGGEDEAGSQAAAADRTQALGSTACSSRMNNTFDRLLECVTLAGVRAHQTALQAIADANGGERAAGTPGYEQSVSYVVGKMTAAGYDVTLHPFTFQYRPLPVLNQLAPVTAAYETGSFTGSGFGSAAGYVTPVDINLAGDRANTSGCDAADFAVFPVGHIALVQRGSCNFSVKALNAQAAGAIAVIVFNQGDTPQRLGPVSGTLGAALITIPVVGASFDAGVALSQPGSQASLTVAAPQTVTQHNVIAESRAGDPNNVVMVGAHLDSVQRGPGINDNGSGSAAILETAIQLAKVKPRNKLRFAWWGAEESGLLGSTAYVASLSAAERARIALYLNFDMVGSPNHVFFIYDGDNSDGVGEPAGPAGSGEIEKVFEAFYTQRGIPFKGTDFSGRSDYGPFIAMGVDIPSGGLFTGAEGIKTAAEAATWGGTAGEQYDPCYHEPCDTLNNVNLQALDVNSDAVAYATLFFAMNTATVNGQRGKGNFSRPAIKWLDEL
jgi:Zn-dependent M28 family amino/carboxypeptidase